MFKIWKGNKRFLRIPMNESFSSQDHLGFDKNIKFPKLLITRPLQPKGQ